LDEGRTEVDVPELNFPGQTVAGYDLTVDTPELFGSKRSIAERISRKPNNDPITP
jgi:hypothetical protein